MEKGKNIEDYRLDELLNAFDAEIFEKSRYNENKIHSARNNIFQTLAQRRKEKQREGMDFGKYRRNNKVKNINTSR